MNQGWRTKADVLKDLGEVNGRRTGAEHLDQHVVAGERPPPIHHEAPDAEEMSYFFGGGGASPEACAGPDLGGISVMLQMVNGMDDTVDHESITLYRNNMTDEFRISKLNPCAGEYVPGTTRYNTHNNSPKKRNMCKGNDRTFSKNIQVAHSTEAIRNRADTNVLPQYNNMFKSKSEKAAEKRSVNDIIDGPAFVKNTPNSNENNAHAMAEVSKTEPVHSPTNSTLINGLPKRKIEKPTVTDDSCKIATSSEEIKEIQEKIQSTIIAASTENSLQSKRQKNVAIATLLKMGTAPKVEETVKLIKPDYFENPPSKENIEKKSVNNTKVPSSETNINEIDQDSISKVNGWFNSMESPKPKAVPQEPLTLKDNASAITFKKKTNSSVTSRNSDNIKDNKKEPPLREIQAFKPSSYASDLLKRYEGNARAAPLIEDLGTRLERQLRERDERIRQKMTSQKAG